MGDWSIQIGESLRRREVHQRYKGQQQGGISTPAGRNDILVFTDPEAGKAYGYDRFEGLRPDGNYAYTGEGQVGPQTFTRGNKAIRNAPLDGKTIRLFRSHGPRVTYVGAFTLGDPPYSEQTVPDIHGESRPGIIFYLAPLHANTELLPAYGGEKLHQAELKDWEPPSVLGYTAAGSGAGTLDVSRVEFELQADYGSWLRSQGRDVRKLRIPAGSSILEPDLYDATGAEIIEAKKSSAREYVRTAIGQVLDYRHNAQRAGMEVTAAILLPGPPEPDLVSLCADLKVRVHVRHEGTFVALGS